MPSVDTSHVFMRAVASVCAEIALHRLPVGDRQRRVHARDRALQRLAQRFRSHTGVRERATTTIDRPRNGQNSSVVCPNGTYISAIGVWVSAASCRSPTTPTTCQSGRSLRRVGTALECASRSPRAATVRPDHVRPAPRSRPSPASTRRGRSRDVPSDHQRNAHRREVAVARHAQVRALIARARCLRPLRGSTSSSSIRSSAPPRSARPTALREFARLRRGSRRRVARSVRSSDTSAPTGRAAPCRRRAARSRDRRAESATRCERAVPRRRAARASSRPARRPVPDAGGRALHRSRARLHATSAAAADAPRVAPAPDRTRSRSEPPAPA